MKNLVFTKDGNSWVSAKEQMASSKALVQIVFKTTGNKIITFQRSLDGVEWSDADEITYYKKTFDTTLVNGGSGLYIRIITNAEVDYSKIELNA